ncbi:hypothetical protein SAMN02745857_01485 [Andreprevotia lacus DSM 23236]|jgi:hypothetical protein|uniref:Uncharacterized protein n=1 Tax=Andreprevotia lacus DSM 23236 TaxID=1121001 RepID=A0A1W1XG75_9NEIS|nr:hypothetical protein [Andreprevotia lacus]SMC22837.1 hypothetical protein SAMN02745857_01485 [Andreprevotia lacus DSM 23236]
MPLDLAQPAAHFAQRFAISDEGKTLLGGTLSQTLAQLQDKQLWPDALHLLAYALNKRDAVAWAWAAANTVPDQTDAARAGLQHVQQWLQAGDESLRLGLCAEAQAIGMEQAAASVALAAFWSGGSMVEADQPELLPADSLCHHAAACAVQLAGSVQPEQAAERYKLWIKLAAEIAAGKRVY